MFIDAFMAQLTASPAGTFTETTTPGYQRQPISFGRPASGAAMMSTAFTFGAAASQGTIAGRAICDAPSGGNMLLLLPLPATRALTGPAFEKRDVGGIVLMFDLLAGFPNGDAFTGVLAANATVGSCFDVADVIGTYSAADTVPAGITAYPLPGGLFRYARTAPMTVGPGALVINRGTLQLRSTFQGVE